MCDSFNGCVSLLNNIQYFFKKTIRGRKHMNIIKKIGVFFTSLFLVLSITALVRLQMVMQKLSYLVLKVLDLEMLFGLQ